MKKALIVMAVLIAVVASTNFGGVQTASAFNPQPEPPLEALPDDGSWMDSFFDISTRDIDGDGTGFMTAIATAVEGGSGRGGGGAVGIVVIDTLPDPGLAPGLNQIVR